MKERFFVTGAGGFIGACLIRRLIHERADVSIILKPNSNTWRVKEVLNKVRVFKGDLADIASVFQAVKAVKPTVIYHLAAHGAYPFQKDAEKIIKTNVLGTWNLLKACDDIDYKIFVNTGSSSEYGAKKHPMKETDVLEPNSYYAVAKSAQTLLCQHVARSQKRPICTFRLFSVYGYYEESTRLVPTLIRSCLTGQDLNMVSPKTARDFIFIEDVLNAYLRLERLKKASGEIFNIGTGRQTALKEIVGIALDVTGAKVKVSWGKMPPRIWDTDLWVADMKKTNRFLSWKAKASFKNGFTKTVEWFQQNRNSG